MLRRGIDRFVGQVHQGFPQFTNLQRHRDQYMSIRSVCTSNDVLLLWIYQQYSRNLLGVFVGRKAIECIERVIA